MSTSSSFDVTKLQSRLGERQVTFIRQCIHCKESTDIIAYADDVNRWQSGVLIQDVWPELSVDDREMIKTGIHPKCWDKIWGVK